MDAEKFVKPLPGFFMLFFSLILFFSPFLIFLFPEDIFLRIVFILSSVIGFFMFLGLTVVDPNDACVLILFGKYKGTVKENGFYFVNPFMSKKKISLKARSNESQNVKVNDKLGNPIIMSVIAVWKVENIYKAAFDVEDYLEFVKIQIEAAARKLAHTYPYDMFDDEQTNISLRSGGDEINNVLEEEVRERLSIAGIKVLEARISNISYAPEIAGAMLQRQQATAIIAARTKIVEGAVSMVDLALTQLSEKDIVLNNEQKASIVGNLMVVLCSDKAAQPIINTEVKS